MEYLDATDLGIPTLQPRVAPVSGTELRLDADGIPAVSPVPGVRRPRARRQEWEDGAGKRGDEDQNRAQHEARGARYASLLQERGARCWLVESTAGCGKPERGLGRPAACITWTPIDV